MKLLSLLSGPQWQSCAPEEDSEGGRAVAAAATGKRDQILTEILMSENLVVLAGLGTTLCLNQAGKPAVAPTMDDLWAAAEASAGFDHVCKKVGFLPTEAKNIEVLLSRCQLSQALNSSDEVHRFIAATEAQIFRRCRFVSNETSLSVHETFLRKVARRSSRHPRCRIFTTNYDLCFETAASHARFIAIDGFSHTQPQEFDGTYFAFDLVRRDHDRDVPDYIPNVFHLYKMHGSVDWEQRAGQVVKTPEPATPLIVYPRHNKFEESYAQPFIEMMSRFQMALRQPNTGLMVIGFGFNDPHVWQPVMSAVRSNVSLKAIVVDPALETLDKAPLTTIVELIRAGDSRLSMLSAGFQDLVSVLPDLVALTEEEGHRLRVRGSGARQ